MAERYTAEVDRTKKHLIDCYTRLAAIDSKVARANNADDLDELERVVSLQVKLIERVEFLKARLRVEVSSHCHQIDREAQNIASVAGFNVQRHYMTPSYQRMI